jgi:4,5-dihydroxyphthalate decarboxylase
VGKLKLSLACGDYDRTRALFDGRVRIEGCETLAVAMSPEEAFHRAFRYQEFDITELSMGSYMIACSRGPSPYVGIPVFLSRMFRHSSIYIRDDRGIVSPKDLIGKTVGVPEYQITAALWVRGILQHEYGVKPSDVRWRSGGVEEPGRGQVITLKLPEGIELKPIGDDTTLSAAIDSGEIDALVSPRPPSAMRGNPKIRRLFPDYRSVETAYFIKTRMFPIMHLVGIRRTVIEQYPWLAVNAYNAFLQAKNLAYVDLERVGSLFTTLPWPADELDKARTLMGQDYWRYGIKENAAEIAAMIQYVDEQGLSARKLEPKDIFAASTFELAKL